jgi:hypothetical protein
MGLYLLYISQYQSGYSKNTSLIPMFEINSSHPSVTLGELFQGPAQIPKSKYIQVFYVKGTVFTQDLSTSSYTVSTL